MTHGRLNRAIRAAAIAALCALSIAGCADKPGGPIAYGGATFGIPDGPTIVPLGQGYRIAPLDTLTIKVFKMPDLSGEYDVDLTGTVSLPLIGAVPAAELTTAELDDRLTAKLGEKYLQNPDVSVGVKSSTRRSVTVDGAVKTAGSFPINGPTSLMQAVALSGGLSEEANARRVAVFRQISGTRQAAAFDLAAIRKGQAKDPAIYPGDIVIVDGSGLKAAQKKILNNLSILSIFRPL